MAKTTLTPKKLLMMKKIWLYFYRINRDIVERDIKKFINNQHISKNVNIIVTELPTENNQSVSCLESIGFTKKNSASQQTGPKKFGIKDLIFKNIAITKLIEIRILRK